MHWAETSLQIRLVGYTISLRYSSNVILDALSLQLMAGGVEAAAIIFSIFVVLRLGIRINLVIYMYIAGIACLMVNFVPEGDHTFLITLVLIGE